MMSFQLEFTKRCQAALRADSAEAKSSRVPWHFFFDQHLLIGIVLSSVDRAEHCARKSCSRVKKLTLIYS